MIQNACNTLLVPVCPITCMYRVAYGRWLLQNTYRILHESDRDPM